ncbi:hypothetical protein IQ37_17170, partial [Chryseobacterium piperi]
DWKTASSPNDNLRRYGYVYDGLNRLLAGFYQRDTNPSAREYFEKMDYDLNGNIINLKRSANIQSGNTAVLIDDLNYQYIGNRLQSVTDIVQNLDGYPGGGNTISYDLNGNMIKHLDKDIISIKYNHLNLPNDFTVNLENVSQTTKYIYRSDGTKVRKLFRSGGRGGTKIVDYLDGFQYEEGIFFPSHTLYLSPTSEGYYDYQENRYIYQYKDHLGNVRVSYVRDSNTQTLKILDQNDYYPYGMNHLKYENSFSAGINYKNYQYNGKELQEMKMYDYGARFYMQDIGRWGVVDPLAEQMRRHSPYNYAFNNPIRFIDPDGRKVKDWYQNNLTQNIEWHNGSAELDGYTNLTAINNTRVLGVENGQTVQEFNLNPDGSFTADGQLFNNGDSAPTLIGTTITSKPGFDLAKWLSHLGNQGGNFYANLGGAAPQEYNNPFFRGDIDKIVDAGGYFGGMANSLSRGNDWKDLMAYRVDIMALGDLAFSAAGSTNSSSNAVAANPDTLSFYGSQAVGLNIYRGSGDRITGVGVKTQDVYKTNMSRSQKDSMINRVNADGAKYDRKSDSVLRRIMKSR